MQGRHSRNSLPLYGLSEPPSNPFWVRRAVEGLKACLSWESGRVDDVGWGRLLKFGTDVVCIQGVRNSCGGRVAAQAMLNLVLFDSRDRKSNIVRGCSV